MLPFAASAHSPLITSETSTNSGSANKSYPAIASAAVGATPLLPPLNVETSAAASEVNEESGLDIVSSEPQSVPSAGWLITHTYSDERLITSL